jgi:peptide/nickel transport system substrate-binding protein
MSSRGVVAPLALAAAVLAAAGSAQSHPATRAAGGTIHAGTASGDIDHLDPALWYFATTWSIAFATCTPLLTYRDAAGNQGSELVPGLAAALPKVSQGGRSYTFTLRPNLRFSNGAPITPAVVKSTFLRLLSAKLASPAYGFFQVIAGAPAYNAGKAKDVSGIKTTATTISFRLSTPTGSFLRRIAMPFSCPVPPGTPTKAVDDGSLPSSGPYAITSYTPNRSLVLERNPNFDTTSGRSAGADRVEFQIGVDPTQAGLQIQAGQLDFYLSRLAPQFANQALRNPALKGRVFANPDPTVIYLWLNNTVPPLDKPQVRQAINLALNRSLLVRVWGGPGQGRATDQIFPPTMPGWKDYKAYPNTPNLARAKALMQAAGVTGPVSLVLRTRNDAPGFTDLAQSVQAQLAPLGFKLKLESAPDSVNFGIISTVKNHIPMGINAWTWDYPDGDDFFGPLLDGRRITPTGNNDTSMFDNADVNRRIDTAQKLLGARRVAAWQALDELTMRRWAPWAPLLNTVRVDLVSSRIAGYLYQPVYGVDIAALHTK